MLIETKYNIGDRVWYLTPTGNNYAWGKVLSFDITNRCGEIIVIYHVENRFYKHQEFWCLGLIERDWHDLHILDIQEFGLYPTVKDLIDCQEAKKDEELMNLTELKKGLFV